MADYKENVVRVGDTAQPGTAVAESTPDAARTGETAAPDAAPASRAPGGEPEGGTASDTAEPVQRELDPHQRDLDQQAQRAARRAAREEAEDAEKPQPQVIEIRPMATAAEMHRRHWGLLFAFLLMVILPVAGLAYYLFAVATDQYASTSGFSVRNEDMGAQNASLMGGLTQFVGGGSNTDANMLYEFIQGQDLVATLDQRLDLRAHYTAPYDTDPLFSLKPDGTIEDLVDYWQRVVSVTYDNGTGLISLHVRAFTPEMAKRLSEEIILESQDLINELNTAARTDMLKYAEKDLEDALARLKETREALVQFRTRTQIVDPESDLAGRMGILNSLQEQLAQALIEYDLVAGETVADDPRVDAAARRIEVIRARIDDERRTFYEEQTAGGTEGYPELLAEYESLMVDREFSEEAYRTVLAALDIARANAARQSLYLATYLKPTTPERADYPQRGLIFGLSALFLLLFWAISALLFYAFRDRK